MKNLVRITLLFFLISAGGGILAQNTATADPFICPPCGDGSCDAVTHSEAGNCPVCGMRLIKKSMMKNVAIFIYDGVEILDFSGPGEVFAATHTDVGAMNVYTVAATRDPIISQGFVRILPEYSIEDCPKPDIIVLPGGNTRPSVENKAVIDWINAVAPDLYAAISVCTGVFILQKAGLLKGEKATTWHGAIDHLREIAPETEVLTNTRWVDNGRVLTTAGVSAGIDGALHVVDRLFGREAALATAHYMEYDKWDPNAGHVVKQP